MLSLFNPAMATLSGTLSFFMPGIFGILGILGILGAAGMLLNQVAGWLVLAGVASASGLEGGVLRNFAYACKMFACVQLMAVWPSLTLCYS